MCSLWHESLEMHSTMKFVNLIIHESVSNGIDVARYEHGAGNSAIRLHGNPMQVGLDIVRDVA